MTSQQATQTPSNKRPSRHNAEIADKERKALEMRIAGARFDDIAQALGYADRSGAQRAVTRALTSTLQPAAEELREVEASRLDVLLRAVWGQALDGDLKAVDRALRIIDQRARLLGLNLPAKSQVDVTVTERSETDVALDELVAEMERRAAAVNLSASDPGK